MDTKEIQELLAQIEAQLAELPRGSISTKTVNNHTYYYHRWYEGKSRKEQYVAESNLDDLREQLAKRKALEAQRKELKRQLPKTQSKPAEDSTEYITLVRRGASLRTFSKAVAAYRKRELYEQLRSYVFGQHQDKVLVLYGLRRTGKTTMIRQILAEMDDETLSQAAFIQLTQKNTLAELNKDLRVLEQQGCRYVFLDEVTLMEDFIGGAALLSDIFAASGMKIVLSGTDSLGFLFTEDEQLYDRCILLHTTFIPYREFDRVLGIQGIDEYIRYGGTMSMSGVNYNESSTFATNQRANEYVDSAIAHNIQHSLRCYQQEGHFRKLQDLYEKDELTSAINRVVEDQTHRFTLEVLTREFHSGDFSQAARNLRKDREQPNDILDRVDKSGVVERLRKLLEIRNQQERTVALEQAHVEEIQEYLALLDLTHPIEIVSMPSGEKLHRTAITQPGLRYAQAKALIESLLLDPTFSDLSLAERNDVQSRILSGIMGRMMEDVVLLETALANPDKQVFVLQFAVGEIDMGIFDPKADSCKLYEIKHSVEIVPEQARHLLDAEKCRMIEHRYGTITGRHVIYRGIKTEADGIQYLNVESYLCSL